MNSKHYWVKVWITATVIAFVAHAAVKKALMPAYDGDLAAIKLLDAGDESKSYELMKENATQAFQIASNSDIKKLADFWRRISDFYLKHGVSSSREGFSGAFKMVIAGTNPFVGVEAVGFFVESLTLAPAFKRTEPWYYQQLHEEVLAAERAAEKAFWVAAIVFIAMLLFARAKREQITRWLDSREILSQAAEAKDASSSPSE